MILTVTPNPAWDITITAPLVPRGESVRIDTAVTRAGGKGVNVARVLAQAGYPVTALVPVAGADQAAFRQDLGAMDAELVPVARPMRRSFAVVESDTSAATVLNERGEGLTESEWRDIRSRVIELLPRISCVVVSGSLPPGTDPSHIATLVGGAVTRGIPVIADLSGDALVAAAAAGVTLAKPNRDELRETTGEADPLAGAHALQREGAVSVLVSLGADGMILVEPDGTATRAGLPEPLAGNPTGAGDAAAAALASCFADGIADAPSRLRRAVAWSAGAVLEPAAGGIHSSWPDLLTRVRIEDVSVEAA